MKVDRIFVERAFGQYVSAYDNEDPKIKLKIDHAQFGADLLFGYELMFEIALQNRPRLLYLLCLKAG